MISFGWEAGDDTLKNPWGKDVSDIVPMNVWLCL